MKQNRESLEANHTKFEGCAEKAIVNESEIAALAKHRKAEAIPLNEAIERIVAGVDINFPSAYNPHISVDHILGDGPGTLYFSNAFSTLDQLARIERFIKLDALWRKAFPAHLGNLEDAVIKCAIANETVPLVIGNTAGLRTAGYSSAETAMMLRSFLRNVEDDSGEISPGWTESNESDDS